MVLIRRSAPLVLACVLLLAGGCGGNDPSAAPSPTSTATTSAPAAPSDVPTLGGDVPSDGQPTALPSDFPTSEVPIIPGPVTQPLGAGSAKEGWVFEIDVSQDATDCFESAANALIARGFTKQAGEIVSGKNRQAQFTRPGYAVIISTTPTKTGGCKLGYEVGKLPVDPNQ